LKLTILEKYSTIQHISPFVRRYWRATATNYTFLESSFHGQHLSGMYDASILNRSEVTKLQS